MYQIKRPDINSPEGDPGNLELSDIIDVPAIQALMDDFYQILRIPMAIIDNHGKVLVGVGWQRICTDFHRAHPEACQHCIESDTQLSAGVAPGEYRVYHCAHHMNDVATPIVVGGRQFGNLFTGQFFFDDEHPDRELFRAQARLYGFDEESYLAALDAVPTLSRETLGASMAFFMRLADMISKLSYSNLKLARSQAEIVRQREWLRVTLSSIGDAVMTVDTEGRVSYLNPAAEALSGWTCEDVMGRPAGEIFRIVNEQTGVPSDDIVARVLSEKRVIGLANHTALLSREGREIPIEDSAAPILDAAGEINGVVLVFHDVTQKRRIQQEREITIEFLHLVNESTGTGDLVRAAATFFQKQSRCEAVGIRLAQGEDFPYYEAHGFPEEFLKLVNSLCSRDCTGQVQRDAAGNPVIECMCGNVICGRTNSEKPFFTPHGSFWSNDTTRLLATTCDADRQARTRNRCNGEGYESVALLPLRVGEERLGLLQLNDRHPGKFAIETIELWERLAGHLAVALAKFRTEEALRENREWLHVTLNSIGDAVLTCDGNGRVTFLNPVAEALTGWKNEEAQGRPIQAVFVIINEQTRQPAEDIVGRVLREGHTVALANHTALVTRDGREVPIEDSAAPIRDAAGSVAGVVLVFHDVTAKRRAQEALRDSEDRLRFALETCHTGAWDLDLVDHTAYRSLEHDHIFGYPELLAQWTYEMFIEHVLPEDRERVDAEFRRAVESQGDWSFECRIRRTDGQIRWILAAGRHRPDADGNPRRMAGIVQDITERKLAEEALRESEERFRAMADAIPQLAWIAKADGFIYWYNQRWYAYTGTTPEQMEGWGWQRVHDPEVLPSVIERWKASIDTGAPFDMVFPLRGADGRFRSFLTRVMPLKDAGGRVIQWFGTNTDVTERVEAEEALRESEERLRVIMDNSPDPIFLKDRNSRLLLANPATLAAIGKPPEEILGKTDEEFYADPEIGRAITENDRRIMDSGRTEVIEENVKSTDGLPRTFLSTKTPHRDAEGRVIGLIGIARDITESKRAEEERQTTLRRFYTVLSSMYGAILLVNDENRIEFANQAFCDLFGLQETPDEVVSISVQDMARKIKTSYLHPEVMDQRVEQIVREGRPVRGEEVAMRNRQTFLRDFIPITIDGKPYGRLWHHMDITERKQLEETQSFLIQCGSTPSGEDFFQALARYLAENLEMDFVCIDRLLEDDLTAQTVAVYFDGKFEDNVTYALKDTPCGDVVGKTICCFPRDVRGLFPRDEVLQQMIAESYVGKTLWSSQGRTIGLIAVIGRKPLENPKLAESILKLVSVRAAGELERKHAEDALRLANAGLTEADRRKDEFLAMLAHELRNPLAPVRNAVQVLRIVGGQDPVMMRQRDIIDRQVSHMARLLDDLLDISRITRGKIELQRRPIYLADALAHAIETATPLIETRRHRLTIQMTAEDLRVDADPDRLAQVVGNLLANAAKYTEAGGQIWLESAREGNVAIVRVRDNGVGIEPEMLPWVFELFAQADRSLDRSQGGLGIGLTLVRSLVEMHGGSVEARSAGMGRGSEFLIRLPLLTNNGNGKKGLAGEPEQPAAEMTPRRVLLVEDVIDSAESLTMLLELWGHTVRTVHNGPAGLEAAREFRPEVVLLDIGLPGMNGYDVARHLRREFGETMRIVALTGYAQDSDRQNAAAAGFNAHLAKPVNIETLQGLLK